MVAAAVVLLFLLLLREPDVFRKSARKLASCFLRTKRELGGSGGKRYSTWIGRSNPFKSQMVFPHLSPVPNLHICKLDSSR